MENGVADLALHEDQHHFLFRLDRDVEEFLGFLVRCSAGVDYCSSSCPRGLRGAGRGGGRTELRKSGRDQLNKTKRPEEHKNGRL